MKIAFIGLGRMGQVMAQRILAAGHETNVYDPVFSQADSLKEAGANAFTSVSETIVGSEVVITMLPHDTALHDVTFSAGGILKSLETDAIHMPMGTHGISVIRELTSAHAAAGQILVAANVLGRPDLAASGQLGIVPAGPADAVARLQPIFDILGKQTFIAGTEPQAAAAVKIANNFVLGCAIEAIGEAMSLVRKLGVEPQMFQDVLTQGLFGAPAYKTYGQIIVDQSYDTVGASARIGLKDMNLALSAAEVAEVPLPGASIMRDRLLSAIAHGDGDCDWSVVAREQARASGLDDD